MRCRAPALPGGTPSRGGEGAGTCQPCTAGNACPFPDQAPYACPTGYTSDAQAVSCTKVDASASGCLTGQFAYPNPNICMDCPVGFECPEPLSPPIICTEGFYADAIN